VSLASPNKLSWHPISINLKNFFLIDNTDLQILGKSTMTAPIDVPFKVYDCLENRPREN
jgi:hypothetical protein